MEPALAEVKEVRRDGTLLAGWLVSPVRAMSTLGITDFFKVFVL